MVDKSASIKMQENEKSIKMNKKTFVPDFVANKDFVLVQNEDKYVFEKGKKASETNSREIPIKFEQNLKTEKVIK